MTIKERLRTYRDLILYIKTLDTEIESLYSRATSIQSRNDNLGTTIQCTKDQDPIGDIVSSIADKQAIRTTHELHAAELRDEIDAILSPLTFWEKRLMHLRYILGYSWEQVAADMCYHTDHIKHRHGDILQKLNE